MKTKIIYITILIVLTFPRICYGQNDLKAFENQFNRILENLDSLIINSENKHDLLVQHYKFIKDKIYNYELKVVYDSTLNYDFFGCASFDISMDNDQNVNLSYGKFVTEKYETYPALIYAILINTFQYAYDYFNNQELFLISKSNQIERIYFEMDALTLEAIFLKVYTNNYENLGYFEKYLIADLQNNLYGSATLFKKTDLELLHLIDGLKYEDKSVNFLLNEFRKIGKDLIEETSFNSDDVWANYCSIITLRTYTYYSPQVIYDIINLKNGISKESINLEDYPENYDVIRKIQKIIEDNNTILSFYNETMKMFEAFYK